MRKLVCASLFADLAPRQEGRRAASCPKEAAASYRTPREPRQYVSEPVEQPNWPANAAIRLPDAPDCGISGNFNPLMCGSCLRRGITGAACGQAGTPRESIVEKRPQIPFALWCLAAVLCVATLCLIFLGGQVKSHEAGLAVPDWPLTYGQNPITYPYQDWVGNIFHEHFHRLWAGSVATLTLILALLLQFFEPARWLKGMGWLAVCVVLLQATLGGLTVLFKLPVLISSSHALLAQTFFAITIVIAFGLWRAWNQEVVPEQTAHAGSLLRCSYVLIALVYLQLFLGALMRHTESGLAVPDFPATGGQWLPRFDGAMLAWINDWRFEHANALGQDLEPVTMGQVVIHFLHRAGALAVLCGGLLLTLQSYRQRAAHPLLFRTAGYLWALLLAQITLGALTVWTAKTPLITSLHVVTGAAFLGFSVVYAARAWVRTPSATPALRDRPSLESKEAGSGRSARARSRGSRRFRAYLELTKPRIFTMVMITTAFGFSMGRGGPLPLYLHVITLLGTGITAAGAGALNQYYEREVDALMKRTRRRPLPQHRIAPGNALAFGLVLTLLGGAMLCLFVNVLSGALAWLSALLYVGVYTPLKRYSWLNTTMGAIPGAIPPLIGWAAATGQINLGGWVLFLILFLWQHPHFYSIAWMFRDDYGQAGFQMLPVVKPDGRATLQQSLGAAILLVPIALMPTFVRVAGWPYFAGALVCSLWFAVVCARWRMTRTNRDARGVLRASVIYLPLLLLLIIADAVIS